MNKIIKITEGQLMESEGDVFSYIDSSDDDKPFDGQSMITAQGKLDGVKKNGEPIMTDRVARQRSLQTRNYPGGFFGGFGIPYVGGMGMGCMCEGIDVNKDNIDDFYSDVNSVGRDIDQMSDGDPTNNLEVIPPSVDKYLNNLLDQMKQHNLNNKQVAMVMNKMLEENPRLSANSEFVKNLLRQKIDPKNIKDF